jgi:hypothetical protein
MYKREYRSETYEATKPEIKTVVCDIDELVIIRPEYSSIEVQLRAENLDLSLRRSV